MDDLWWLWNHQWRPERLSCASRESGMHARQRGTIPYTIMGQSMLHLVCRLPPMPTYYTYYLLHCRTTTNNTTLIWMWTPTLPKRKSGRTSDEGPRWQWHCQMPVCTWWTLSLNTGRLTFRWECSFKWPQWLPCHTTLCYLSLQTQHGKMLHAVWPRATL